MPIALHQFTGEHMDARWTMGKYCEVLLRLNRIIQTDFHSIHCASLVDLIVSLKDSKAFVPLCIYDLPKNCLREEHGFYIAAVILLLR